jgi:hypothetical protein
VRYLEGSHRAEDASGGQHGLIGWHRQQPPKCSGSTSTVTPGETKFSVPGTFPERSQWGVAQDRGVQCKIPRLTNTAISCRENVSLNH